MRKSKINKMKLTSLLLLSTVLIPDIAYADEEIDESIEAETYTVPEEVQNTEETVQTINETETETKENAETSVTTEGEAGTQEGTPESDTYNNDIETDTGTTSENVQEESTEGGGDLLQPAEPNQQTDQLEEEPAESEEQLTEDETDVLEEGESQVSGGEEETPGDTSEEAEGNTEANPEPEYDSEIITDETAPESSETDGDYVYSTEDETDVSELPIEQINPIETVEPEETEGTEIQPEEWYEQTTEEESTVTSQPSEGVVETAEEAVTENAEAEQETVEATAGTGKKKLYRYDYGDILSGISFSEENIAEDLSTLDQRVTRVMSSKIIEEKDLTEAQKLELEETVKAEEVNSYDGEELPNTGEADSTNYAFAGLLTIFGTVLVFMSKKLKTDN
ncbi:Gram positive anchor [Jeotgalicoccus saudimassiliensis]|uniref:Gram positive anchor n=1 Tax=Jeotgalicoccus saudimassiliensis TaxID=1461582 RepID=A0A078MB48_9STAP|nr:LPXTG cell wall anchor domain-containing protein [Jeotgalicoccus saudimassiliensis]CEA03449.1 Gram positive anchor [Jeotgalicoccus saudimassiliensis]